jgi:DNA replication protein DnaC
MKDGRNELRKSLQNFTVIPDEVFEKQEAEEQTRKQAERANEAMKQIPLRFRDASFDNYEFYGTDEQQARQHKLIESLKAARSLVLYGNNGTGKTRLAFASMKNQVLQGKTVMYATFMEIMDEVHKAFGGDSEVGRIVTKYANYDYLVVDEIDKSYGSKSELINLFRIVNQRYNDKLPTVLITNAGEKDEEKDGDIRFGVIKSVGRSSYERIVEDGTAVLMDWESYRKGNRGRK